MVKKDQDVVHILYYYQIAQNCLIDLNIMFNFIFYAFFSILEVFLLPLDIIIIRLVQKWETEGLGLLNIMSIGGLNYLFYHFFMFSHFISNFDIIIFQQYRKKLKLTYSNIIVISYGDSKPNKNGW